VAAKKRFQTHLDSLVEKYSNNNNTASAKRVNLVRLQNKAQVGKKTLFEIKDFFRVRPPFQLKNVFIWRCFSPLNIN
jgi:hypothetical protein